MANGKVLFNMSFAAAIFDRLAAYFLTGDDNTVFVSSMVYFK